MMTTMRLSMTRNSKAYEDALDPVLYDELTDEQELEIIGEPFVVNDRCGICLVPVRDDLGRNLFAFCEQKELHELLSAEDIEKIKAFDTTPYKQGGRDA